MTHDFLPVFIYLPYRVARVCDARGEQFVVQYLSGQARQDGRVRTTVWYQCCPLDVLRDSPAHVAGVLQAEARAWEHVDQVLRRGGDATKVDPRFGAGELVGGGRYKRHGDPHDDFSFHFSCGDCCRA